MIKPWVILPAMRFRYILDAVYCQPWNITASGWLSIHRILQARLEGHDTPSSTASGLFSGLVNERPEMRIDPHGVAHIHIMGVLGRRLSPIEKSCGNTDYADIEAETHEAAATARAILYHIDSPGGAASGNTECARIVAAAAIPTAASVQQLAASAAYAIAAGCDAIIASPSALIGSIGTILPLVDTSAEWAQRGWKPAYITHTGGDLKDASYPPSFSTEHRAYLQQLVDQLFRLFQGHVLAHRDIAPDAMRGQLMVADAQAIEANLIDRVGSPGDASRWLLQRLSPAAG